LLQWFRRHPPGACTAAGAPSPITGKVANPTDATTPSSVESTTAPAGYVLFAGKLATQGHLWNRHSQRHSNRALASAQFERGMAEVV
jgi:hypothetical protein